jgi:cytochrome oxidase Cu insertion factor (SCO1/SenC/PrrC family)
MAGNHRQAPAARWTWTALACALLAALALPARGQDAPPCPACAADPPAGGERLTDDPWVDQAHRPAATVGELAVASNDGKIARWNDLRGQPSVITFIFTRCSNPNKCPRAGSALGELARAAQSAGLAGRFHAAIATYDPSFDTGERLARWAGGRGVTPDLQVLLLRPDQGAVASLVPAWHLGVSFAADGSVAVHDLELLVLDSQLRLAHRYHTTLWDGQAVLADVRRLLAEPASR